MMEGQENDSHDSHDEHNKADGHEAHDEHVAKDPLSNEELFAHVQDGTAFHLPRFFGSHGHFEIPQVVEITSEPSDAMVEPLDGKITKFMLVEVAVAVLVVAVFLRISKLVQSGAAPKGKFWNLFEVILLYIRDDIARPAIGREDSKKFMPFLWTIFFFVLGCNLLGMVPWLGTPTGSLSVTGILALATFGVVLGSGFSKLGFIGFWKAQIPHMDLPAPIAVVLIPMIFVIEVFGLLVKHFVLAVRLLANMFAGHMVLAVMLAFIAATGGTALYWVVMPGSLGASLALSLLEVFVAFLQAYIFTFLSALFIGSAVHPH